MTKKTTVATIKKKTNKKQPIKVSIVGTPIVHRRGILSLIKNMNKAIAYGDGNIVEKEEYQVVIVSSDCYNSPLLSEFLRHQRIPTYLNGQNVHLINSGTLKIVTDKIFDKLNMSSSANMDADNNFLPPVILCTLEDSYDLIKEKFPSLDTVNRIDNFKDKYLFRKKLKSYDKNFKYQLLTKDTIFKKEFFENNPKVLKPVSGISSTGVKILKHDLKLEKEIFISASKENPMILEDYIDGTEIAVDGFFDTYGKPTILNIMKHDFFSENDVSDYLYYTNFEFLIKHLDKVTSFLEGPFVKAFGSMNCFPFHFEARVEKETGKIIPIELNPYRFSGYGSCDLSWYAYGINPYDTYFFDEKFASWNKSIWNMLPGKEKKINYGFISLENEDHHKNTKELNAICEILEYRIIDLPNNTLKAMVFFKCEQENMAQLKSFIIGKNNIVQ